MKKKIIFTVTTDIMYDQRMERICSTLADNDFEVVLVGRKLPTSKILPIKNFQGVRLKNFFNKGKLFYLEHNIRLFFYLLFHKADIICGIDLDTIIPSFTVAKWKKIPFVYDAHEYFPEQTQVVQRPKIKAFWEKIESQYVPRIKHAYTVNNSLASFFKDKHHTHFDVITNASRYEEIAIKSSTVKVSLEQL